MQPKLYIDKEAQIWMAWTVLNYVAALLERQKI